MYVAGLHGLKGGFDIKSFLKYQIQYKIAKLTSQAPVTAMQTLISIAIGLALTFGGLELKDLLFSPKLVARGEFYRIGTSFIVIALNSFDFIKRIYGLLNYQQDLEAIYTRNQDSDEIRFGRISWDFLVLMAFMAGIIATQHMFTPARHKGRLLLYSLYPALEQSVRWMWAFTVDERAKLQIAEFSISPWIIPLALSVIDGMSNIGLVINGFIVASVTSVVLSTRRQDGTTVREWAAAKLKRFWKMLK